MAQLPINLNELGIFSGCYESIWLHSETNLDELNQMTDDLGCEIESDLDFYKYLKAIAETYESYLENEFGGTFITDTIYSPKYYNYETDTIELIWEKENLSEIQMQKLLDDKFEELDDSELWDIEAHEIHDGFNGYELYPNMVRYYVEIDGEEKDVYWDDKKEAYTVE